MFKRLVLTAVFTGALLLSSAGSCEVVVIANSASVFEELSHDDVVDLYLGNTLFLPDGNLAMRLDQSASSSVREKFYDRLIGMSAAKVNAYWARLLFTGKATPPYVIDTNDQVIQIVRKNPGAIGYIDIEDVDDTVRIIAYVK